MKLENLVTFAVLFAVFTSVSADDSRRPPSPSSCHEIKKANPRRGSGIYYMKIENEVLPVYCHMDLLCNSNDGWTRIASLNMNDKSQSCPSGLTLYTSGNIRACGRRSRAPDASCDSTIFSSMGIRYSQVCGSVYAYQYNSPDAYAIYAGKTNIQSRIDSAYIDGVSITHGTPRKHIWSLMAAQSEKVTRHTKNYVCPCTAGNAQPKLPSFIGYHTTDPLWDGKNCRNNEVNCCKAHGLPWFHKNLGYTTNDDIELRICGDQSQTDEDARVFFIDMFVK
ncbi:PREDICTED: uncharacterized protein LOC109580624 [Amphimedon queenslandica]|uniref:Fibrinogen C-terminal domain-containing protein n=1 Tax=Amphimedon queenslandica TaxID=400682 RepID=A0AAN0IYQ0_AMPQE|nr:PREDICTED: uncharacterized protein LOC109580624 [Amphimedon queenslandica]|eukprot:XP_019849581.1 PREDICTED: uncharacterized protein LOC109580624 [Amphimedon queenslandica]